MAIGATAESVARELRDRARLVDLKLDPFGADLSSIRDPARVPRHVRIISMLLTGWTEVHKQALGTDRRGVRLSLVPIA